MTPPIAQQKPHLLTLHGHTRLDNYFWLRERTSPEVLAYIKAENEYTDAIMAHAKPLQDKLYQEMVGRIQETDSSAPYRHGDYFYYNRTEAGKEYPIYCRKLGSLEAAEEVLIDLNALAEGHDYLVLGVLKISPNQRLLAYSLDTAGNEKYTLFVKHLGIGDLLPDQIENVGYSVEWTDNETLFYNTYDAAWRSDKVWRHRLGTAVSDDTLMFHEPDELFDVDFEKTRDGAYLVMAVGGMETREAYVLDARVEGETAVFHPIHPRQRGIRYSVDHHNGTFYIITNENALNNQIMTVAASDPARANWQPFLPHRPSVKIDGIDLFANHLVIYERENGLQTIQVMDLSSSNSHYVAFPEAVYSYEDGDNHVFASDTLRFDYQSLTTAKTTIDYDMVTQAQTIVKRTPVLGGYDPANYQSERIWATADDGTQVPISLVYRRGTQSSSDNPMLLYGYGSYGASIDPLFDANRLSLVDRGFVFGIAHIRGGGEMGRQWYEQGKFLHKINTFTDFVACARHLIASGYTNPNKLTILGRSAGGLLMGAVLNLAPELFHAAIAGVAFVDVVSTMLDTSIPLTAGEFEEWGNPQNKDFYDYMLSYSPYDQLEAKAYPHILATAGLNDPRVQYWEPTKWVAKLRTLKTDDNRLLLKTNMGAGHFSASGRYAYLEDLAFQYAFLLDVLGIVG